MQCSVVFIVYYSRYSPTKFFVPNRNTGKSFERPGKILRGLLRFGKNLGAAVVAAAAGALTLRF